MSTPIYEYTIVEDGIIIGYARVQHKDADLVALEIGRHRCFLDHESQTVICFGDDTIINWDEIVEG